MSNNIKQIDGETVFDLPEGSLEDFKDPLDLEGCETFSQELEELLLDFARLSSIVREKTIEKNETKETILELWDGTNNSPFPTKYGRVIYRKGYDGKESVDDKACTKLLDKALNFEVALDILAEAGFDRVVMKGLLVDAMGKFKMPMKKTAGRSATLEFEEL